MPVWRLQCAFGADTSLARDRIVINPCFDDHGVDGAQMLASDLADALATYTAGVREIRVKAYDAEGSKPVYPAADELRHPNLFPLSPTVRELALCLSFYSTRNIPRHRGRLYIPAFFVGSSIALRPTDSQLDTVRQLAPIFQDLGTPATDWVVYSKRDATPRPVTDFWVDDEWDIQRSRGLKGTKRVTGTTSEADAITVLPLA